MDSLIELIDNRIDKALNTSAHVNSLIGQVVAASNDRYDVKLFTTGAIYNLPNYSGSDVNIGEQVYVYYSGGFLSNQTAYIGASLNKPSLLKYIYGIDSTGILSNNAMKVSSLNFITLAATIINLVVNVTISSNVTGTAMFTVLADDIEYDYKPMTTINDGYTHCSFTLPVEFDSFAEHTIYIKATGVGEITQVKSYIFGFNITDSDWIMTDENDYIYEVFEDHSETWFYIGSAPRICMPQTLEGKPLTIVHATTFNFTGVTGVKIPEGIIIIE